MSGILFTIGVVVWLIAAVAFARIVRDWFRVYRSAPAGQGLAAALELGSLNESGLELRLGAAAGHTIRQFRTSVMLFAGCVAALIVLVVVNIATGNAA